MLFLTRKAVVKDIISNLFIRFLPEEAQTVFCLLEKFPFFQLLMGRGEALNMIFFKFKNKNEFRFHLFSNDDISISLSIKILVDISSCKRQTLVHTECENECAKIGWN